MWRAMRKSEILGFPALKFSVGPIKETWKGREMKQDGEQSRFWGRRRRASSLLPDEVSEASLSLPHFDSLYPKVWLSGRHVNQLRHCRNYPYTLLSPPSPSGE